MGLPKAALRFLAREHRRRPFSDAVLTIGRQSVFATLEEARGILRTESLDPCPLPPGFDPATNIPSWAGTWNERCISDIAFFKLLGVTDSKALDCSAYERADFVHDLNEPAPESLKSRFSLILDGGSLEHIFDVRTALKNIAFMLKPGGRVIHFVPSNNFLNHGFYQFSPTLFYDYYGANRFADLRGYLAEESRYLEGWELYAVPPSASMQPHEIVSTQPLTVAFIAQKTPESTEDRVPSQGHWYKSAAAAATKPSGAPSTPSISAWIRSRMPRWMESAVRRYCLAYDPANRLPDWLRIAMIRWVPGFDKIEDSWRRRQKPWGLEFWARLD